MDIDLSKIRRFGMVLIVLGFIVIITACHGTKVTGKYNNPYTLSQVKDMMAYHGALIARFDGNQWWFLSGNRWIKLENDGAYRFAFFSSRGKSSEL